MGARTTELEIARQVLTPDQFALVRAVQRRTGQPLLDVVLDMEMVDEEKLAKLLQQKLHIKRFSLDGTALEPEALLAVDRNFAVDHGCLPVGFSHSRLLLAMVDPLDEETMEHVSVASGYPVEPMVVTRAELKRAVEISKGWEVEDLPILERAGDRADIRFPVPIVVFLGYPDGVGKTFLMWNLAFALSKRCKVLLVEVGLPDSESESEPNGRESSSPFHLYDVDADLIYVPEESLIPERLEDLAEQSEKDEKQTFELVLAELGEGPIGARGYQMVRYANLLILVTEVDKGAESWELIREILEESSDDKLLSVGVVFNKAKTREQGEAGLAAIEAAARSTGRHGSLKLWLAGVLPYEPHAVLLAERAGKVIVDAFPKRSLSREIRALSKKIDRELSKQAKKSGENFRSH